MSTPVPKQSLIHAYRHLYRTSLRAVRYAHPARYEIRDILRDSFRTSSPANFNLRRVQNTLKFLENARKYNGFEHRILKNLLHLQFWKIKGLDKKLVKNSNTSQAVESRRQIWHQYRATLTMLNESLDICLTI
ncbi:hypothetical protein AYL99_06043 [Fonsecaea erecta]|uniref:Uncharacterized protein n=1 Tax=Fonsecaea erecta TaxID=1367422 RepID=A0A178ZMK6_9EURO|nr:hypothetical protein AYL99_06043 [Fonsecaea erecta]OAP61039.1 hypothetical protein AYL99_06043 [Fonsecaea erecta]